jgi:catechol 2,3-dioxygenase-like lactoylglutathione lyase family enzyme
MRVHRLDHVLLAMPPGREADARKFYQDILGIPEAQKPADLAARGGCWFEDGELRSTLASKRISRRRERRIRPSSSTIWRD